MTEVLAGRSVTLRVGDQLLVDAASLSLVPGEIVALVGPNGAGKSTLLRVLSGDLAPGSGSVHLKGRALALLRVGGARTASRCARTKCSYRIPVHSCRDRAHGRWRPWSGRRPRRDRAGRGRSRSVPRACHHDLVGRRAAAGAFARVLAQLARGEAEHGPGVLLLDEPTASLDLRHQLDAIEAISRRAGRGTAVVAVLHDLNLAARLAARIVVLDRGRIDCDGPPGETMTNSMLRRVFGVTDALGLVPAAPFVLPHAAVKVSLHAGQPLNRPAAGAPR